ncbi:MAG: cupin domain-containing protein [Pseudomonadales bacterium]|nr:cupin domain-containing protein [Pseudomonadales bacterium]
MSVLTVFEDNNPQAFVQRIEDHAAIAAILQTVGIRFERWQTSTTIQAGDSSEQVMAAYQQEIDQLLAEEGYQSVDVISLNADDPETRAKVPELRQKFLSEHRHSEDEVRFFVAGKGLFSLHLHEQVYEVLCEQGDLISVPANTPHWFDMGPEPCFVALRFFNNPEGWVANYTGSPIADQFSRLES